MLLMGFASNGVTPHPSRKAREGWGTHFIVVRAEGWATRQTLPRWLEDVMKKVRGQIAEVGMLAAPRLEDRETLGTRLLGSQVIDALEVQEIKETGKEEG